MNPSDGPMHGGDELRKRCYTDGHPGMPVSILDTRTLHVVSKNFVTQTKIGADSSSG